MILLSPMPSLMAAMSSVADAVDLRIAEAYQWLLVPGQPDPKGDLDWTDLKLQGQVSLATRAARKLKKEESLLIQMREVCLQTELDRIPLRTGRHVNIKQLAEYMARHLYLPRLRDEQVLIAAIQECTRKNHFGRTECDAPGIPAEPLEEAVAARVAEIATSDMWTVKGLVDLYFLVFLHVGTRRCWISPCTLSPDSAWVSQQAKNFVMEAEDLNLAPQYVMRDNDTKFSAQFDEVFKTSGVEIKRTVPLSPNLRAHVERFIQSLKFEVLDKFVIVAERRLNHINREWRLHYNRERPHEARGHLPPGFEKPPETNDAIRPNGVVSTSRLGGLLKHYERRAA